MPAACVNPKFRRQHLFVGSGVIEAGYKTVIVSRLKQSGMFWTVRRANGILALRCCQLNRAGLRTTGRLATPLKSNFYVATPGARVSSPASLMRFQERESGEARGHIPHELGWH
jgi:hypothetical protein